MHYKLVSVALLIFLGGCLSTPWQDAIFLANTSLPIPVEGCFPVADFKIEIWARRPPSPSSTRASEKMLATVRTGKTAALTEIYNGVPTSWFCFSTEVEIPSDMWVSIGSWPGNAEVPASPSHRRSSINAFYPDFSGVRTPFSIYNNDPLDCPLPMGWSQITGDTNGDGWLEPNAQFCALQTDWVEVRSF